MAEPEEQTEAVDLGGLGEAIAFTCSRCTPVLGPPARESEPGEAAPECLDTVAIGVWSLFRATPSAEAGSNQVPSNIGGEVASTCTHCGWAVGICSDLERSRMREGIPPQPDEVAMAVVGFVRAWLRLAS